MKNTDIRNALKSANMKHWQLAEELGISEYTLCKHLRKEMTQEKKNEILRIITKYKGV